MASTEDLTFESVVTDEEVAEAMSEMEAKVADIIKNGSGNNDQMELEYTWSKWG